MKHLTVVLFSIVITTTAFCFSGGPPVGLAGNPPLNQNCTGCHSSFPLNSGDGSLDLAGLPSEGYEANTTYSITLTLDDPGQSRWGFELTVQYLEGSVPMAGGELTVTDPVNTRLTPGTGADPDYLMQTSTGTFPGTTGPVSWTFDWTAPPDTSVGPVTFYAAGNGANNNGNNQGDYIYTDSWTVSPSTSGYSWRLALFE